ncbi:four-carbon acid sugar kinase family protein [Leptolyngbya sp. PCC 6406]|uniref:four-carbon acid sugar kinase family protein n=1 Tax=Leptolyngbya sp. PCC 6406 TaxID=1173264 RepID=UPI000481BE6A|nr:four-carbon acid sugar kinase family protein [Leptolyngbya sp. PCC 6406]
MAAESEITAPKIIVLDDDPTGSQTVHSCLLLMQWDVETLVMGLQDRAPIVFILTNTRALPPAEAEAITRTVCRNLKQALPQAGIQDFLVVSRSDSTLRGHYPVETDAIAAELGPFDAHFLVPAFFEGGRITRDSVHYVMQEGSPVPAHETEFARDSVFGYSHSYLPDYVAEKTQGHIPAAAVERFTLDQIRQGSRDRVQSLQNNTCAVVDGETQADLDHFAQDVIWAAAQGKRFLFRSAASLLTALAALPPQPVAPVAMAQYVRGGKPGAVLVGSHVQKTTQQLAVLLEEPGTVGIEVDIAQLAQEPAPETRRSTGAGPSHLLTTVLEQAHAAHRGGQTPVIYTSRQELTFDNIATRLAFGQQVSELLMDIERGLPATIGFLISKGGITSNDTLSSGLALRTARLLGQIIPGCSVVCTPTDHPTFPDLPVVLFPGNVGDADALALAYRRFQGAAA